MAIEITITGNDRELQAVLRRLEGGIDAFNSRVRRSFDETATHTTRATQRMQQAFARMQQDMQRNLSTITSIMQRFQAGLAAFGAGVTLGGLATGAIEVAASFQQLDTQLRFVVGGMAAFNKAKQFILDFTATTPFQLGEVSKVFIDLTRRGLDVERVLRAMGEAASVQRFPSEALDRFAFAVGQIADRGKLAQQELNQLSEAGLGQNLVLAELSAMGVKWGDDIGAAGIKAGVAIEAVTRAFEKNFAGALAASQANWVVVMSNLVDTWNVFQAAVVRGPLFDFLTSLVLLLNEELSRAVKEDTALFRQWGETAVQWIKDTLRWLAMVADMLATVGQALTAVETAINNAGSRVNEFFRTVGSGLGAVTGGVVGGVATGLEALLAPPATVQALRQAADTLKGVGEQGKASAEQTKGAWVDVQEFMKGPYSQSLEGVLTKGEAKMADVQAAQKNVFDEQAKRIAEQRKRLAAFAQQAGGDGGKAAREAGNIAAERARAEEQTLEASLRRQVERTKIAADERRRALDQELSDRLAREPAAHEAIELELQERRREITREEAEKIYQIEVDLNQRILAATEARLNAEIKGAAGKPVQIAKFEADLVAARADADTEMAKSAARRAQAEQQLSKQTLDQRLDDIAEEEKAVVQGNQAVIRSRLSLLQAEEQLLNAEQKSAGRGGTDQREQQEQRIVQIRAESFALQEAQIRELTKIDAEEATKQIQNGELLATRLNQINEEGNNQLKALGVQRQTDEQRRLDEQLRDYERFVEDVENTLGDFLYDIFSGQIDSISDLFDSLKQTFFRMIADMIAFAIARPIVVPIISSLVGGAAGLLGGAAGGGGGGLFDVLGLAGVANQGAQLFGVQSPLAGALDFLTTTLDKAAVQIGGLFGTTVYPSSFVGPVPTAAQFTAGQAAAGLPGTTSVLSRVNPLLALGGLAGIGGGIFSALGAQGLGGLTGGAIGAAGGGLALATSLGVGLAPIFGPIGLALAALAPLLGNLIDTLGAPKGPRFALGELEGLDVVVEHGMLQVAGTLTSAIGKAERLPEGQSAKVIQSALETGVQDAVSTMVNTISAVALDPDALLGPTQEALQTGLDNALRINSAAKGEQFAQDIAAQTLAVVTQIGVNFLGPLGDALQQVFDAELDQQIRQLPRALDLAVAQLKKLTDAVTAIEETGQSDASNVLPQLKNQIAAFRKRLIDNTVDTLNEAFTGGVAQFQEALQLAVSLPQGVIDLHAPLGQVQQIAQAFAAVFGPMEQAAEGLETALAPAGTQITELRDKFNELRGEIIEAGDNIDVALPLFAELQQAVLAEANARIQAVQTIGGTLQGIERSLFQTLTPSEQAQTLLGDIAALERELAGQTGLEAAETAGQLAQLYDQLLAMGEAQDNLALTAQAITGLETLQPLLEQQLVALGGSADVQQAIRNIQQQSLDTLKTMQADLYNLFLSNQQVATALNLPVPVTVVNAAQRGGFVGYARGGRVLAEPGELIFPGPLMPTTRAALETVNRTWPRFMVGGAGEGDSVPVDLPGGGFVLNRMGSRAVRAVSGGRGLQTGGAVPGGSATPGGLDSRSLVIHIHNPVVRTDQDLQEIARRMRDELRKLDRRTFGPGKTR